MSKFLSARELKEQGSLVDLLDHLGYHPLPGRGQEKIYFSMLSGTRDTKPLFSINENLGVWFDRGVNKGGNIIDFGLAFWKELEFDGVVKKIQEVLAVGPAECKVISQPHITKPSHLVAHQVKPLGTHPAITNYLKSRGVFGIAKKFMSEIYYFAEDDRGERKPYFAGGWLNEKHGWEVRNQYFKGCVGQRGITFIPNNEKKAAVFDGFIDFLSWKTEYPDMDHSIIVLNHLSLLQRGVNYAKAFSTLDIFFNRDKPGKLATNVFVKALPYATDRSKIYEGFHDYNDKINSPVNRRSVPELKTYNFQAPGETSFRA